MDKVIFAGLCVYPRLLFWQTFKSVDGDRSFFPTNRTRFYLEIIQLLTLFTIHAILRSLESTYKLDERTRCTLTA